MVPVMKKLNALASKFTRCSSDPIAKKLMLFLAEKGEEEAAEHQQKVISSLEDAKFKLHVFKNSTQTTVDDFIQQ